MIDYDIPKINQDMSMEEAGVIYERILRIYENMDLKNLTPKNIDYMRRLGKETMSPLMGLTSLLMSDEGRLLFEDIVGLWGNMQNIFVREDPEGYVKRNITGPAERESEKIRKLFSTD